MFKLARPWFGEHNIATCTAKGLQLLSYNRDLEGCPFLAHRFYSCYHACIYAKKVNKVHAHVSKTDQTRADNWKNMAIFIHGRAVAYAKFLRKKKTDAVKANFKSSGAAAAAGKAPRANGSLAKDHGRDAL